jgi:hypothetical protein
LQDTFDKIKILQRRSESIRIKHNILNCLYSIIFIYSFFWKAHKFIQYLFSNWKNIKNHRRISSFQLAQMICLVLTKLILVISHDKDLMNKFFHIQIELIVSAT